MQRRYFVEDALLEAILKRIEFRLVPPGMPGTSWDSADIKKREAYKALDVANTQVHQKDLRLFDINFLAIPRYSTLANAYILNRLVSHMPEEQCYLNVGVWCGFSFLAGILGNEEKVCIGVDNFSDPVHTKSIFEYNYARYKSPASRFFEIDYQEYFARIHQQQVGVYFYDGDHAYEHQYKGLELADPFLVTGSYVVIDDTNKTTDGPYAATMDFVKAKPYYKVVLDIETAHDAHPTFWNGLLILKKL